MTADTQHDLASVTKIVATTTALIRLVSDGLVGLDDPARRYLPGLGEGEKASITVRQLLLHRAGLWEWHPLYLAAEGASAASAYVERLPLRYRPDTERHYSDLGFMLLGRIVAAVTGQPFEDSVTALVTGPLGMASTQFVHPVGEEVATSSFGDQCEMTMVDTGVPYPVPFLSADFGSWRQEPVSGDVCDGNAFHVFAGVSGHAGLFSTLTDLVTFADALANYSEHEELWDPHVAEEFFAAGPDAAQALGFRRYRLDLGSESVDLLGHPGFVGCAVGFVPGRGIALALASNRLLTPGAPVPTEHLWEQALAAASTAIRKQAA
jgi:CubicO group peptidase (beta-lactamase class C family)